MSFMLCPYAGCGHNVTRTLYSRTPTSPSFPDRYRGKRHLIRRSKRCDKCGRRFFTVEILESDYLMNYQDPNP